MTLLIPISLVLLYVLTQRSLGIHQEHKGNHPAIAVSERTLVPTAKGYIAAFQSVQRQRALKNEVMLKGRASIDRLVTGLRSFLGMVVRDLPSFELDVDLDAESPDYVLGYTENLVVLVEERKDSLPYAATLLKHVGGLLAQAQADWGAAQQALTELQELRRKLREQSVPMHRELVAFRRTLRAVLGASHRDCQRLRIRRGVPVEATELPAEPETQPSVPTNGATPPRV